MKDYKEILELCEAEIRAGRPQRVARHLNGVNLAKMPRELRLPIANLCRRANLGAVGLRILAPLVHPKGAKSRTATPAETSEYGILLHRLGATKEALKLLESVKPGQAPNSLLFRSFCHFSFWHIEEPVALLSQFEELAESDYMRFVGRVNLALALSSCERFDEALDLTARNIEYAEKNDHGRLLANCHEIRAQIHCARAEYGEAKADLENAARLLAGANTNDSLYIQKWRAFIQGLETKSVEPVLSFQMLARKQRNWESVREADRYALKIKFDLQRFHRLVFGSPHESYRRLVYKDTGRLPELSTYRTGPATAPCFDLATGLISGEGFKNDQPFNVGKKLHQLIDALLRDLYRPMSAASLFADLFPDEHYDADFSPPRVHQAIFRVRRYFEEAGWPVVIGQTEGFFRLRVNGEFAFLIPLERQSVDGFHAQWSQLVSCFSGVESFTQSEAREKLGLTRSSFQRLSRWAAEKGLLERHGKTTSMTYRICKVPAAKSA